jgi:hypothetical protein
MKTTSNHLTGLFIGTLFLLSSCQKQDLTPTSPLSSSTALRPICGKQIILNLSDKLKTAYGSVILSNDQQNFYVKVQTNSPWVIKRTSLWTGPCENMDEIMSDGSVVANLFNHHSPVNLNQDVYEFTVALSSLPECFCYTLYAIIVDPNGNEKGVWADGGNLLPGDKFGLYGNYCVQKCHTCGGLRTQTQGGWGAVPHGNNPGAYLHAHFAAAFPSGLTVGCDKTITLTSAQAVTNFLPQGGSPKALTTSYVNPTNKNITVLAGQVVALKLNVVFDEYDPNFGAASDLLKNRVIVSGPFQGWTVAQLLAEAEKKLGGCASPYSFSQLNNALDAINNNYANGNTDLGYLTCPK